MDRLGYLWASIQLISRKSELPPGVLAILGESSSNRVKVIGMTYVNWYLPAGGLE